MHGAFKRAAGKMMRRVFGFVHLPPAMWDTLTWLRQWEMDDPIAEELYPDSARPGTTQDSSDLFPRL